MAENIGQTESNRGKQDFERQRDTRKGGDAGGRPLPGRKEDREGGQRKEMGSNRYDYPSKEIGGQERGDKGAQGDLGERKGDQDVKGDRDDSGSQRKTDTSEE